MHVHLFSWKHYEENDEVLKSSISSLLRTMAASYQSTCNYCAITIDSLKKVFNMNSYSHRIYI